MTRRRLAATNHPTDRLVGHSPSIRALRAQIRVVEEKRLRRLGAVADHPVDVKFIAATQMGLSSRVAQGRFRTDLYHRLAVVILALVPLRQRGKDIVILAEHLLRQYAEAHKVNPKRLSRDANTWLLSLAWPGNVRELSHLMERATLLCPKATLDPHTLERLYLPLQAPQAGPLPTDGGWERLDEPARIRQALVRTRGNVLGAARLLGLSRSALRYRLRRYGIGRPDADLGPSQTSLAPGERGRG
jgi:DNA-binding NtrC family response regulator